MKTTNTFSKIAQMRGTLRVVQGGTSAGKTYAIMQLLDYISRNSKKKRLVTVATDTTPNLKTGAIRDFKDILKDEGVWNDNNWNATDKIYTYDKCQIEFVAFDKDTKARGGRRDILFLNEANRLSHEIALQLMVRTREYTIIDYNPEIEFWVHDEGYLEDENTSFIIVNYKDNQYLEDKIIKDIESKKPVYDVGGNLLSGNENWWRVYGEGQLGVYEGLVFQEYVHWEQKELPPNAKLICYGLDFGYSSDPTSLTGIYYCDGRYYFQEIIYKKGLTNLYTDGMTEEEKENTLQRQFEILGISKEHPMLCDSAEPKSIQDLRNIGYNARGAQKGKDSIKHGIDKLQSLRFFITPESVNALKEARMYCYKKVNGRQTNEPVDDYNHFWDSARYGISEKIKTEEKPRKSGVRRVSMSRKRTGVSHARI